MLILLLILVGALLAVTLLVVSAPQAIDELTITRRAQSLTLKGLGPLLHLVNLPGYPPQVLILGFLLVAVPFVLGWKWIAVTQAFVGLGVGFMSALVKLAVHRARPSPDVVVVHRQLDGGGQSYPAGHCADYVARFGFILYLLTRTGGSVWWVWLIAVAPVALIGLVGLARIYSGEHWMTDVLGGYLLGGIWLIVTLYFYHWTEAEVWVTRHL